VGDSVMAFWAPPLAPGEDAVRACRAARLIRAGIATENARRRERGAAPIRLRIGIHRGPALVGNVGAAARINYTVVGDTVNVAQRIDKLCESYWDDAADATILVSDTVAGALPDTMPTLALGEVGIRGREGTLKMFRLV
jgi:adenylate cyclase